MKPNPHVLKLVDAPDWFTFVGEAEVCVWWGGEAAAEDDYLCFCNVDSKLPLSTVRKEAV